MPNAERRSSWQIEIGSSSSYSRMHSGFQGTASDIEVQAREIIRMNARLQEMMAADTGQSVERLGHDINRDYWMSAAEAKEYGVVDLIVGQTEATAAADRAEAAVKDTPGASTRSANGRR